MSCLSAVFAVGGIDVTPSTYLLGARPELFREDVVVPLEVSLGCMPRGPGDGPGRRRFGRRRRRRREEGQERKETASLSSLSLCCRSRGCPPSLTASRCRFSPSGHHDVSPSLYINGRLGTNDAPREDVLHLYRWS